LNFQYWYAFGFGYTLCNATTFLINLNSSIEKRSLLFNLAKYISHLLLTIQCFIIPSDFILPYYYLSFGITVLIVITFWCLDGKIQKQEPTSKDSTNSTLTSDLETINNTITNTENELITKIKEVKSLLKDVIDKIKDIKNKI
jgi:ATP-dependent Zn protease